MYPTCPTHAHNRKKYPTTTKRTRMGEADRELGVEGEHERAREKKYQKYKKDFDEGQLLIKACVCEFRRPPAAAAERPIDVDAEIDLKPITLVQLDYCYYYCSSSSSLGLATIRCGTDGLSRVLFHFLELFRLLSFTYITLSCNTWAKIHQRRTTTTTTT